MAADAPVLAAILRDWIRGTPWMPDLHSPDEDRAFVGGLIASQRVRMAEQGGEALGFLAMDSGMIGALYVARHARGKGTGSALLDDAKANAPRLSLWTFQENTQAQAFYLARGFVEARRTDGSGNEERLPDILLVWPAPKAE